MFGEKSTDWSIGYPESTYLGVIDYKSSHRKFNMTEAYYGLAMQMLTYLDVALMDAVQLVGQEAKPAGSLYLHVHNPTLSYEGKDDIEQQMLKNISLMVFWWKTQIYWII